MRYIKYLMKCKVLQCIFIITFILMMVISTTPRVNAAELNENENHELDDSENDSLLLSSGGNSDNPINVDAEGINNFTNVNYIPNANYFKANPFHAINDSSDNGAGTCTTVAMQLLMGYHNYYSDRRLIPQFGGNGLRYLSIDYGYIYDNPKINQSLAMNYGRPSIGTEVGFYEELMDFNSMSGVYGIGQAVGVVADGAVAFVDAYANSIKDNVSITSGFFSESTAKSDIDSGKPIILACQPIFTGSENFHVVVAYGYATYNGVDGFIVHCGWRDQNVHIWYPASWFGFQIRMSVEHTHNFTDTGIDINSLYRQIRCNTCLATDIDSLYQISSDGSSIIGVSYPLSNEIIIPSIINGNTITSIGNSAFRGCSNITHISIPNAVTNIDSNAFEACTNLSSVTLSNNLTSIGTSAFEGCSNLTSMIIPSSVQYIDDYAFYNCTNLSNVIVQREIANTTNLGVYAFHGCKSTLQITVPKNRVAEYKNKNYWSSYKNKILSDSSNYIELELSSTSDFNEVTSLNAGYNKIYKLNVIDSVTYLITATSLSNITIKLYDSNMNLLESASNNNTVSISRTLSSGANYYSVEYSNNSSSGEITTAFVKSNTHIHNYTYTWVNYTQHSANCSCGTTQLQGHAVSVNAFQNGEQYATCLICGGLATSGIVGPYSFSLDGISLTTPNGSYVLPNGVIVLVDEDIEAYMDGTLSFNDSIIYDIYPSNNQIVMYNPRDDED